MISQSVSTGVERPRLDLPALVRRSWTLNRPLTFIGILMSASIFALLVGLAVDPRVVTGAPVWLKPLKFAISLAIYSFTFVWLLSFIQGHPRLVRLAANVTALASGAEMAIIVGQAARGTTSHFNFATPLDSALFETMAGFIVALWLMSLLAAILLLRQRFTDPTWAWSLRLGVVLAFIGMGLAFLMTSGPTAAQQAALTAGQPLTIMGAHSVGVADGGPGLPIVGWSTVGGDLRIGHFVGLHAMQVLPVLGWVLARRRMAWLSVRSRVTLVWTAGSAYLSLMLLLTWQALRGQSVIAPDVLTLGVLAAIVGISGAVIGVILLQNRRNGTTPAESYAASI